MQKFHTSQPDASARRMLVPNGTPLAEGRCCLTPGLVSSNLSTAFSLLLGQREPNAVRMIEKGGYGCAKIMYRPKHADAGSAAFAFLFGQTGQVFHFGTGGIIENGNAAMSLDGFAGFHAPVVVERTRIDADRHPRGSHKAVIGAGSTSRLAGGRDVYILVFSPSQERLMRAIDSMNGNRTGSGMDPIAYGVLETEITYGNSQMALFAGLPPLPGQQ